MTRACSNGLRLDDGTTVRGRGRRNVSAMGRRRWRPAPDDADCMAALRTFRRRHLVRIAWRDLAGHAPVDQVLRELSWLAEACITAACRYATATLGLRHGVPKTRDGVELPLLVLGMGKLGGGELNYSSDIDLVFLFAEHGETTGPRPLEHEEFFARVAKRVSQLLGTVTDDGFVYRVDLRLRPFGEAGPVAVSFDALEEYLQEHGRDWERYAYVKARPVFGAEPGFDALYRDVLRPFVYRRYLDFGVFESLRTMKEMIAREVARRELQQNVKLGPGGIREIEFIVQAFQLLRGGSTPRLQTRSLLEALPLLAGQKLLSAEVVAELLEAYRFLRRVENRLQEWNDEQTHELRHHGRRAQQARTRDGHAGLAGVAARTGPAPGSRQRALPAHRVRPGATRGGGKRRPGARARARARIRRCATPRAARRIARARAHRSNPAPAEPAAG